MATICQTIPVQTTVVQEIGQTVFETVVPTTTFGPPTLVTAVLTTTSCSTNSTASTSTCSAVATESVSTILGTPIITSVTSAITNPVTREVTNTRFTTTCSSPQGPVTPPPAPPSTSDTSTTSISTPTSFSTPNTYPSTTEGPVETSGAAGNSSSGGGSNTGAIVGGVLGGIFGLVALGLLTWYFIKKSKHSAFDDFFNNADGGLEKPTKPGPPTDPSHSGYKYGALETNPIGPATPGGHETGLYGAGNEAGYQPHGQYNHAGYAGQETGYVGGQQAGFYPPAGQEAGYYAPGGQETGYYPSGNDTGYNAGHHDANHHHRSNSQVPLLAAGIGGAAIAGVAAGAAAGASLASRPSTASGSSTQPLINQSGYPPHPGYGPAQTAYPPGSTTLSPSSTMYAGRAPSPSERHYVSEQGSLSAQTSVTGSSRGYGQQFHPDNRTGSPVSIQENRVLQVINPDNAGAVAGGSSGATTAAAAQPPLVDGKGRPVNTAGQMVPIVHLDGGRYEETTEASPAQQPPAYAS